MRETSEVIEVMKETTPEAFDTMINYIYRIPGEDTFNLNDVDCPQKLFQLLERKEVMKAMVVESVDKETLEVDASATIAQCKCWKTGLKVVNFEKLFLHQFSTKIYQTLKDDV